AGPQAVAAGAFIWSVAIDAAMSVETLTQSASTLTERLLILPIARMMLPGIAAGAPSSAASVAGSTSVTRSTGVSLMDSRSWLFRGIRVHCRLLLRVDALA